MRTSSFMMIGMNRQASRTKNLSHPNCWTREASSTRGKSTRILALVHDDVATAALLPHAEQGSFALRVFGQFHRVVGAFHRVMIDVLNHIARLQTGLRSRGAGLNLGNNCAFDVLRDVELVAVLLIEIADTHAIERAGVV